MSEKLFEAKYREWTAHLCTVTGLLPEPGEQRLATEPTILRWPEARWGLNYTAMGTATALIHYCPFCGSHLEVDYQKWLLAKQPEGPIAEEGDFHAAG